MDNTTLMMLFTVLLGIVGVGYLILSQPPATKKRAAKGGLKPRGMRFCVPVPAHRCSLTQALPPRRPLHCRGSVHAVMLRIVSAMLAAMRADLWSTSSRWNGKRKRGRVCRPRLVL